MEATDTIYKKVEYPSGAVRYKPIGERYSNDWIPNGSWLATVEPGTKRLTKIDEEDYALVAATAMTAREAMTFAMMEFAKEYPAESAVDDVHKEAIRAYQLVLKKYGREDEMTRWTTPCYAEIAEAGIKYLAEKAKT